MYNASKSALIMASDIWRREFEPLGVRTLTLITTSVKTPAFDNVEMPKIPETSYYYVIRDYIYRLADGRLQDGAPDPLTYGLKVVNEVDKGTVGEIWVGKDAAMNHWAWKLLPKSVFVSFRRVSLPSIICLISRTIGLHDGRLSQGHCRVGQSLRSDEDSKMMLALYIRE
jgi:1-acylglycerone phosphate reductase